MPFPIPRKDFVVNRFVQISRCYAVQDRLCFNEVLKDSQSRSRKVRDSAHSIIGHLNRLDDAVGEVQVPLRVSNIVRKVHYGFRSEERIYNHVLDCTGLNEW